MKVILFLVALSTMLSCSKPSIVKGSLEFKPVEAEAFSISRFKGYLNIKLQTKNTFDKEILYAVIEYKYVDKYDTEYFSKRGKITEEFAKGFKGDISLSTLEEYNDVSMFLYTKVPSEEIASKAYLLEGLQVKVLMIAFKDGTKINF